jgi:Flp pilus assembly protein TadG
MSLRGLRRVCRRLEVGTSALELSLVLPVFLVFVIGTVDFGRAIVLYNAMGLAARDGARVAQVRLRPGDLELSTSARDVANAAAQFVAAPVASTGTGLTTSTVAFKDASGYWYVTTSAAVTYVPVAGPFLRLPSIPVGASSTLAVPCGKCL